MKQKELLKKTNKNKFFFIFHFKIKDYSNNNNIDNKEQIWKLKIIICYN